MKLRPADYLNFSFGLVFEYRWLPIVSDLRDVTWSNVLWFLLAVFGIVVFFSCFRAVIEFVARQNETHKYASFSNKMKQGWVWLEFGASIHYIVSLVFLRDASSLVFFVFFALFFFANWLVCYPNKRFLGKEPHGETI